MEVDPTVKEDPPRDSALFLSQEPSIGDLTPKVHICENNSVPTTPTVGILKKRPSLLSIDSYSPTRMDCRGRPISCRDESGKTRHSITWPDELAADEWEQVEKNAEDKGISRPSTHIAQIHQVVSYKAYNKDGEISNGCSCVIL